MSATTTSVSESPTVAVAAAAAAAVVEKVPRKFPPPCWTQEETLALIEAYRDRWYALRRGYLRTADWDAVATAVTESCPGASPAKTSAQCRHKMEKLRQRYRTEKQRSLAYPSGRFFSSWFFFENMDAMENGTSLSAAGTNQDSLSVQDSGNGFRLKTFLDQNTLKLKLNGKNATIFDEDFETKFNLNSGKDDKKLSSSYVSKGLNDGYNLHMSGACGGSDVEEEDEDDNTFGSRYRLKHSVTDIKTKKFRTIFGGIKCNGLDVDHGNSTRSSDFSNGFNMRNLVNEDTLPPVMRAKRFGKLDRKISIGCDGGEGDENNGNDGFWGNKNVVSQGSRVKYGGTVYGNLESRGLNGYSNGLRPGAERAKRERDPVEDMAMSIKMLGEGFVKMEQMKMDMARDMEKMRMEMEMKRNELIMESQKQIMNAFVKGLLEIKNKQVKREVSPES